MARPNLDDFEDIGNISEGSDNAGGEMEEEEIENEEKQNKLLEFVESVVLKKKKRVARSEAAQNVNEFSLPGGNREKRSLTLEKIGPGLKKLDEKFHEKIKKKVSDKILPRNETKTLEVPLEKGVSEKIKRKTLYENTSKEVSKWNETVKQNRIVDQLVFPISNEKPKKITLEEKADQFVPENDLEIQIAKALYGEDYLNKINEKKGIKVAGEDDKYTMTMEDAIEKHNEMARLRAQQSYEITKARRRNKIKSKKYHRLLKREKMKKEMKEFKELEINNPEAALQKMDALERDRIRERSTLKHRNTSKWAKMQGGRAKYNADARIALSEQLQISKKLTQKRKHESDSEDEGFETDLPKLVANATLDNPWMLARVEEGERNKLCYTGYKKLWENINAEKSKKLVSLENNENGGEGEEKLEISDSDDSDDDNDDETKEVASATKKRVIDPQNFIKVGGGKKKLQFQFETKDLNDNDEESSSSDSEVDEHRMTIAEAFEDDEVIVEFQKRKRDEIEANKPKDIDLTLPGWGEWAGKNIKPSKHKKKFIKKGNTEDQKPRKDSNLPHVILNENANDLLKKHQVQEVPFPFKKKSDFEERIKNPIGRDWVGELKVKEKIKPKVITRLGAIIKPINEDVLIKDTIKLNDRKVLQKDIFKKTK